MKITVVGIYCVGLSSAMLLSQTHEVISLDAILDMIETEHTRTN
jgi:UDP-glucose 6-dehydrogenase